MKTEEKMPYETKIGKYSYGCICRQHELIKEIGAFCSFADGVEVVLNHEMNAITTHPMVSAGVCVEGFDIPYDNYCNDKWWIGGWSR